MTPVQVMNSSGYSWELLDWKTKSHSLGTHLIPVGIDVCPESSPTAGGAATPRGSLTLSLLFFQSSSLVIPLFNTLLIYEAEATAQDKFPVDVYLEKFCIFVFQQGDICGSFQEDKQREWNGIFDFLGQKWITLPSFSNDTELQNPRKEATEMKGFLVEICERNKGF